MKRWLDVASIAITLACLGFGTILILSPLIESTWIQPLLAGTLALSGTTALLAQRIRTPRKEIQ